MGKINENIKEIFAKGVTLVKEKTTKMAFGVGLVAVLTVGAPKVVDSGTTVVYAAETTKDALESSKSKALKNLEKVYKYYSKSYYSTKEYSKLTKYYNKGVKAIKACKDKTSINDTYNEYKELLKFQSMELKRILNMMLTLIQKLYLQYLIKLNMNIIQN